MDRGGKKKSKGESEKAEPKKTNSSSSEPTASSNECEQQFSALTWGHNDQRLFVACSNTLHVLKIYKKIPTLSVLSQMSFKSHLPSPMCVRNFRLPERIKQELNDCFNSSLKVE